MAWKRVFTKLFWLGVGAAIKAALRIAVQGALLHFGWGPPLVTGFLGLIAGAVSIWARLPWYIVLCICSLVVMIGFYATAWLALLYKRETRLLAEAAKQTPTQEPVATPETMTPPHPAQRRPGQPDMDQIRQGKFTPVSEGYFDTPPPDYMADGKDRAIVARGDNIEISDADLTGYEIGIDAKGNKVRIARPKITR
jgi:hypothetical protein